MDMDVDVDMGGVAVSVLPIRRLTLYKHGVAFVEREGTVRGEEIALTFRADEINDALKSLLVLDRRGGQALGIGYDTPASDSARGGGIVALSAEHSLLDLLRSLRGWRVRLGTGEGSALEEHAGRLIGVDIVDQPTPQRDSTVALLDDADGTVIAVPLGLVRRVSLLEERAAGDLRRLLDVSRARDEQRVATVRLSPGEHDLAVSYLVPSPTWRVSYRLVVADATTPAGASSAGDAATSPGSEEAELLLQGWGLFDNGLDEDLEGVQVTLVAGQPISFVYDLAASRVPPRPVVEDEARVAAQPVEYDAYEAIGYSVEERARGYDVPAMARRPRLAMASIAEMAQQPVAARGGELGELFQYEVTAPVTVRRGASALVPILNARLRCRRELLFNETKLPGHPVAALRFDNTSGLVLERGPVTVLEEGIYRGEAMLPFSKEDAGVYLAYLVELGLGVTTETTTSVETAGLRIDGAMIELKRATIRRTHYHIANGLTESRRVTVEHAAFPDSTLMEVRAPDARTAGLYRWTVDCPARRATLFTVAERRDDWHSSALFDQSYAALQDYVRQGWLDEAMLARLSALLDERRAIAANEEEIAKLQAERETVYAREEQIRKNMAALGTAGEEGALRTRAVAGLQECEDRLHAIHERIAALHEDVERRQAIIAEHLATIHVES